MKDWQIIKKEFESVPSYEQKLLWWTANIPLKKSAFSKDSIQFQYSQKDAPEYEMNVVCIAFQLNAPNVVYATSLRKEFISILPDYNNSKDKQLFFNWVLKETKVDTFEIIEGKYLNDLSVVHIGNRDSILAEYKTQLKTEYNNGLYNLWFKSGYDYARSNNSSVLNFGEPTTFYMDPEFMIKNTIKGYLNNLKELAIFNIENKTIESNSIEFKKSKQLNWDNNITQLYWVFAQAKQKKYLDNSYLEIATFIKENFIGVKASVDTIQREIEKLATGAKITKTKGSIDFENIKKD